MGKTMISASAALAVAALAALGAAEAEAAKSRSCTASYRVTPVADATFELFDFAEARARRSAVRANEARRRAAGSLLRCLSDHLRSNRPGAPESCARDGMQVYSLTTRTPEQAAIRALCCAADPSYLGPVNFSIQGRVFGDTGCDGTTAVSHLHLGQRSCAVWRDLGVCG